jgi:anti-sigma factor RsiW
MTCRHALDLIDAGPFVDGPRTHLDAALEHARHCATCGRALAAATALTADLTALPQPAPPRDLSAAVLARIVQIEPGVVATVKSTPSSTRDWSAWATLGGLAAGLAVILPGHATAIELVSLRGSGMTAGLTGLPGTLAVAAGLTLYVAGLFVPLRGRHRSGRVTPSRPS